MDGSETISRETSHAVPSIGGGVNLFHVPTRFPAIAIWAVCELVCHAHKDSPIPAVLRFEFGCKPKNELDFSAKFKHAHNN
jgi:hypothetical protein